MSAIAHTWFMAERHLRALMRQPWWIVISLVQPVTYLLTFLSPVFIEPALMPGWIRTVSRFNPVAWSVEAARSALSPALTRDSSRPAWVCSSSCRLPAPGSPRVRSARISVRRRDRRG